MDHSTLVFGLVWYMVFVFSTVFHEAAHALVAFKLGDPTAYHGGQVSLNPVPHIRREPFGMILVPIISLLAGGWMIGWASTPYDPMWAYNHPRRSAWMSLAGPVANLILLLTAALLIRGGIFLGLFYPPGSITDFSQVVAAHSSGLPYAVAVLLSILFMLNLILCIFNLLPLPPMDGSGILPLFMSEDSANRYQTVMHQPTFTIIGMLIAWKLFAAVFRPIHLFALNLLYPGAGYHITN